MPNPGLGTIVIYHMPSPYPDDPRFADTAAIVAGTPASFNSGVSNWTIPDPNTVHLVLFLAENGVSYRQSVAEGPDSGQYSYSRCHCISEPSDR